MPTPAKPPAFLLFGGFAGARYPEFRAFLEARRLSLLFVDEPDRLPRTAGGASAATAGVAEYLLSTADDLPRILDKIEAWRRRYDIRGYHNLLEPFVVPAAHVGERLGLPGPGRRASFICRDKCLQRTLLPEWSPPFAVFSPAAPVKDFAAFPAVLKPVGRGGGSGVFKVRDLGEVAARLPAYASGETLLLEAFVDGLDFSVESLVRDGVVCFENITEEHADPRGRFLEMGYTLPAVHIPAAMMPRIYAIHRQVLERIGFQTGIAHAEYRLSASGGIHLMEIAARNPGDGLLPMYELSTGRPLEAEILKLALGEPVSYPRPARPVRQIYFEHPPGELVEVALEGFGLAPWFYGTMGGRPRLGGWRAGTGAVLREVLVEREPGDRLTPLAEAKDRLGSFLMEADTIEELDALEREVRARLRVVVRST